MRVAAPADREQESMTMKTLSARVLDPKHLELAEPLPSTTGEWVRIVVRGTDAEASDRDLELAAVQDVSEDLLSEEELAYYLELKEL